jgi:hypothetical protein
MPLSKYDKYLGGNGAAEKLMAALVKEYGEEKAKRIFYAKVNIKRKSESGN